MNLEGWFKIALLAEKLNLDFWNYNIDGRSLKAALDYLIPYALGKEKFVYEQIGSYNRKDMEFLMLVASDKFHNQAYISEYRKVEGHSLELFNALLCSRL